MTDLTKMSDEELRYHYMVTYWFTRDFFLMDEEKFQTAHTELKAAEEELLRRYAARVAEEE
jgi:hypothetical protein